MTGADAAVAPSSVPPSIGVAGWGRMGAAIGGRLLAAGHGVSAFDPSPRAREAAHAAGASVVATGRDLAAASDVLVTMLPDGPSMRHAAAGVDGLLVGLRPGTLWIEMTSSDPAVTEKLAIEAGAAGADLVDAPVTGGVPRATTGELTVMVAGDEAAMTRAEPILAHLATKVVRVGTSPGLGDVAKVINNLLSAANLLLAGEGLDLAARCGLDWRVLLEVLNSGTGQSNATSWKIPQYVLTGRFDAGFTVSQYMKDLDMAIALADRCRARADVARSAAALWRELNVELGGDDHTRVVTAVAGSEYTSSREVGDG